MTDSVNVFDPFYRLTDGNGDPVSGGKIKFYTAGTTTPLTVYSDAGLTTALGVVVYTNAAGQPVASEGSTTTVQVYVGTADYKVMAYDADDALIPGASFDNVPGALDTSGFSAGSGAFELPVVAKASSSWSIDAGDPPALYAANVAGGSQVASLPSAITAGDGYILAVSHAATGSSNTVTIQTVGGQQIKDGATDSVIEQTALTLTRYGDTVWLVSDGADWWVANRSRSLAEDGRILVAGRLTAPPTSPAAGACYIITGTPTGTWSTLGFAEHDVAEANGIGGWTRRQPYTDCGWFAYVQDEDMAYQFVGSAWVAMSNAYPPSTTYQKTMLVQYQQSNGTAGGAATTGARTTYPINTFVNSASAQVITGATLSSNKISGLPAGWYTITGSAMFNSTDMTQLFLRNSTTSTDLLAGLVIDATNASSFRATMPLEGQFQITDPTHEIVIQYRAVSTGGSTGLGIASSYSDGVEIYGSFLITAVDAPQGPQGATGTQGATGRDAGLGRWSFSTTTTSGTSSGTVRFNSGTAASITTVYINETDADSSARSGVLDRLDDASGQIIEFRKNGTPGTVITFASNGTQTDSGTERAIPVTYLAGAVPSGSDSLMLSLFGGGSGGGGGGGALDDLSDVAISGATSGQLLQYNGSSWVNATVSGTGDVTAASSFGTDNRLIRSDGTGKGVQSSAITVDDSGNVSGVGTLASGAQTLTSTDAGSSGAPDLTLDRNSASPAALDTIGQVIFSGRDSAGNTETYGRINVRIDDPTNTSEASTLRFAVMAAGALANKMQLQGTNIAPVTSDQMALGTTSLMWSDLFLADGAVINFNNGNATVTHSSNLLTFSSPISVGTSNAITAGTIELGAASDTTLSRSSAGNVAIEGNVIYRAGGTDVALADGGTGASLSDPGADRVMGWDEDTNAVKFLALTDMATEAAPATGDFLLMYGAEGDLRKVDWSSLPGAGGGISDGATLSTGLTFPNTGLKISDTNASHVMTLKVGSDLTANRTFTLTTGDAARTLDISAADVTIGSAAATFLGTPSSANLRSLLTDETGTGAAVFADTPTLVTPVLGAATATSINKVALTAPATGSTLTLADGKTLTVSNTLTFTGTDGSSVAFGAGGTANLAGVQEWFIPASCFVPRTSNGCATLATLETSTNKVNLDHLAFDATTQEFAQCLIPRMPKSWNESTLTAIPIWSHPSTTTNFGVVWGVSGVALSDDDAADTAFGTAQTSTDTGGTTDDIYHGPATSAITIGGSPAEGDTVVLQVSRNPSDGSDTMAVDARLHGLLIRVTTNAANDA